MTGSPAQLIAHDCGRVLVTHDWLVTWAGAERVLEQILQVLPTADLVVGLKQAGIQEHNAITRRARQTWLGRLPCTRRGYHYQWLLPLEALAFWTLDTSAYDMVISSCHAFSKAVRPGRRGVHLSYCYSPPRYLWDQYEAYSPRTTRLRRAALRVGRRPMQMLDRESARRVTHFVAISEFVAQRIERVYQRKARVVYPPVSMRPTRQQGPGQREDFLLYLGRLVPYKRLDLLIEAARQLGMRVVIAGDGPDRVRLTRLADGGVVEFLGAVSEADAVTLLESCAAFVFTGEEDFGIAPLEANVHGAPVIAFNGGGISETMQDGVTGVLFDEPTVESLVRAIRRAVTRTWDVAALRANAERFSPNHFREAFTAVLDAAMCGERW